MEKIAALILIACALTGRAAAQCNGDLEPDQTLYSAQLDSERFGTAVAVSEPWLFVSEAGNPDGIQLAGAVDAYVGAAGGWELRQVITASDADEGDRFGTDLAVDGTLLVVGCGADDDACGGPSWCESGSAYVFELGSAGWAEVAKLTASDAWIGQEFGTDVALHGSTIVVGAYRHGPSFTGAAYVFERQGAGWVETAILQGSDLTTSDYFGKSVAVWSGTVMVGSLYHDHPLNQSGAVFAFTRSPAGWVQTQEVLPIVQQDVGRFGSSVSLRGDWLLVGAEGEDSTDGAAYVFERIGTTWFEQARITVTGCHDGRFGQEVELGHGAAFVASECGAYAFSDVGATWQEIARMPAPNGALGQPDLALGDGNIVVSDAYDDTSSYLAGAVWTYDLPAGMSYCTAHPNSTGNAAEISLMGCTSVGLNAFGLVAAPVPDDVGFFVYGRERAILPFGGLLLCVGGPLFSLRPGHASGGVLSAQVDFLAPMGAGSIFPGDTWDFQAWFRDPPAGPGAMNGSNGLEVTFLP